MTIDCKNALFLIFIVKYHLPPYENFPLSFWSKHLMDKNKLEKYLYVMRIEPCSVCQPSWPKGTIAGSILSNAHILRNLIIFLVQSRWGMSLIPGVLRRQKGIPICTIALLLLTHVQYTRITSWYTP